VTPELYDVTLHVMWREADIKLDGYKRKVEGGRCLSEAVDFARWLQLSGMISFFKHHSRSGELPIDGHLLAWKARELELAVCDQFKAGVKPEKRDTALDEINHKLDLIAGRIAQMPVVQIPENVLEYPQAKATA